MKTLFTFIIVIFLAIADAYSQEVDTGAVHQEQQQNRIRQREMIDQNADGIADSQQVVKGKKYRNKKDKFIDRDGDGICDDRASGLGWRLGNKGSIRQGGAKKGPRIR